MRQTSGICVLHVDDEPDLADLTADMLEREDDRFSIVTATNADEGLRRLAADEFDCIISDYNMPRQNGLMFLEAVRETYAELPFILYTGKGSEEVASDAISAGVTDYLQKGRGTDQYTVLANRVSNAVAHYRAQQDRDRRREAIESAREGISILNESGEFIYVNEAYANLYGYRSEEMLGKQWELICPEEEVSPVRQDILSIVTEKGYWHGETTGLRADSTTFPEDHVFSQIDSNEVVCIVRDLSDRRERETELRTKTRELLEYKRIIETMGDGVYALDFNGEFIRLNNYLQDLTGYEPQDIKEEGPSLIFTETAIAQFEETIRTLLTTEADMEKIETEVQTASGSAVPVGVNMTLLPDEDGGYRGTVGVIRDISERKERERELERYERIVQAVPDEVYTLDSNGNFTFITPPAGREATICGYPPEELIGEHVSLIMDEKDIKKGESLIRDLLSSETEQTKSFEMDIISRDDHRIPAEDHIAPLPSETEFQGTVGVLRPLRIKRSERGSCSDKTND